MKHIKKSSFKRLSDLMYTINNLPCKECKKIIKVSNTVYHVLIVSDLLK